MRWPWQRQPKPEPYRPKLSEILIQTSNQKGTSMTTQPNQQNLEQLKQQYEKLGLEIRKLESGVVEIKDTSNTVRAVITGRTIRLQDKPSSTRSWVELTVAEDGTVTKTAQGGMWVNTFYNNDLWVELLTEVIKLAPNTPVSPAKPTGQVPNGSEGRKLEFIVNQCCDGTCGGGDFEMVKVGCASSTVDRLEIANDANRISFEGFRGSSVHVRKGEALQSLINWLTFVNQN